MKPLIIAGIALAGCAAVAATVIGSSSNPPIAAGEAPQFALAGDVPIGTRMSEMTLPDRVRISTVGALTGNLPREARTISVRLWYPTEAAQNGARAIYRHTASLPGASGIVIEEKGTAFADAAPRKGAKLPLVLMSHGFAGWDTYFSRLCEAIASRGYIVASIDHRDMPFDSTNSFLLSFGNVLLDRAQDQRQVLKQLLSKPARDGDPLGLIDAEKIGLVGYSMGGYGAIATAGGDYDAASKTISQLPKDAQAAITPADPATAAKIKALILIAPWGGQPDNRVWNAASLAKIRAPSLIIAGDRDDVVNFKEGVSWVFGAMTGSDRHLLVYREARHNIVGNPVALGPDAPFPAIEYFREPVWRTERINAINQHFITAFLDLTLKGDTAKAGFLNVPTPSSDDGDWPSKLGQQWGSTLAGDAQPKHWRGFQRRWALGLEMQQRPAQTAGQKP